jgi:hypothetical protein
MRTHVADANHGPDSATISRQLLSKRRQRLASFLRPRNSEPPHLVGIPHRGSAVPRASGEHPSPRVALCQGACATHASACCPSSRTLVPAGREGVSSVIPEGCLPLRRETPFPCGRLRRARSPARQPRYRHLFRDRTTHFRVAQPEWKHNWC